MSTLIETLSTRELLAWALADYARFAGFVDIIPKNTGVRTPFRFNTIQKAYNKARTPNDVVLKARQVGQTTAECARDVYHFLTRPGANVVIMVQSFEDHKPLKSVANIVNIMFESLERKGINLGVKRHSIGEWSMGDAKLAVTEAGASEAAANKKGRSSAVTRLHMSEVAFYEFARNTWTAIQPCLATVDAEVVLESTPSGNSGLFFEVCQGAMRGDNGYKFHFFPWFMEPSYAAQLADGEVIEATTSREAYLLGQGVSQESVKWYRIEVAKNGQAYMDQEFASDPETCFLAAGRNFFDRTKLSDLRAGCTNPVGSRLGGKLKIWHQPSKHKDYIIGVDTAEGVGSADGTNNEDYVDGKDNSAAIVYERGTGTHVATLWGQLKPWDLAKCLADLGAMYNLATIAIERNNHGHAAIRALDAEQKYRNIWRDKDGRHGWLTTHKSRTEALTLLEDSVRKGKWSTQDASLVGEMINFIVNDNGKAEAAKGAHDDLVMAAAVGWDIIARPKNFRIDYGPGY